MKLRVEATGLGRTVANFITSKESNFDGAAMCTVLKKHLLSFGPFLILQSTRHTRVKLKIISKKDIL